MNTSRPFQMLMGAVRFVAAEESLSLRDAFLSFINWSAVKLSVDSNVSSKMKLKTIEELESIVDFSLLKGSVDDWFGYVYEVIFEKDSRLQSMEDCAKIIDNRNLENVPGFPRAMLFKHVETGRFPMIVHNKFGNSYLCYGIEKDVLKYHIALINIKLYDLPVFIVNIEDYKGKDFTTSSENWKFANAWTAPKAKWFK